MKIKFYIPVIHTCPESMLFTTDCINSIRTKHEWDLEVDSDDRRGLSERWNYAVQSAMLHDLLFIINNDIIHRPDTIDNMIDWIDNTNHIAWSCTQVKSLPALGMYDNIESETSQWFNWSWFALNPQRWREEHLFFDIHMGQGAYQDIDMTLQMAEKGLVPMRTTNACVFHNSDTSRKLNLIPDLDTKNAKNKLYVENKWKIKL